MGLNSLCLPESVSHGNFSLNSIFTFIQYTFNFKLTDVFSRDWQVKPNTKCP